MPINALESVPTNAKHKTWKSRMTYLSNERARRRTLVFQKLQEFTKMEDLDIGIDRDFVEAYEEIDFEFNIGLDGVVAEALRARDQAHKVARAQEKAVREAELAAQKAERVRKEPELEAERVCNDAEREAERARNEASQKPFDKEMA